MLQLVFNFSLMTTPLNISYYSLANSPNTDLRLHNEIRAVQLGRDLLGLLGGGGDAELGGGDVGVLQQRHGDVLVDA